MHRRRRLLQLVQCIDNGNGDGVTWQSALECVIARTRHERYRVLCSDAWPDHSGYRRLMLRLAAGGKINDPVPIPLPESLALLRLVNSCPYRSRDAACGCSGSKCGIRSAIVSHHDCFDCVARYGTS
jgi:hypothetical protein